MSNMTSRRLTPDEVNEIDSTGTYGGETVEWILTDYIYPSFEAFLNLLEQFGKPELNVPVPPGSLRVDSFDMLYDDHILRSGTDASLIADWRFLLHLECEEGEGVLAVLGGVEGAAVLIGPNYDGHEDIPFVKEAEEYVESQLLAQKRRRKVNADSTGVFRLLNIYRLYFEGAHRLASLKWEEAWEETRDSRGNIELNLDLSSLLVPVDLLRAQFFLLMASFEGFVSMVYEVYLEPEMRQDRIIDAIGREHLDLKVRFMPSRCVCFKPQKLLSADNDTFRKFHYLAELRNKFIHANLTEPMRTHRVQKDDLFFWHRSGGKGKYDLPLSVEQLKKDHITLVFQVVEEMVQLVLDAMKPTYRRSFSAALQKDEIEIQKSDDEYVILD